MVEFLGADLAIAQTLFTTAQYGVIVILGAVIAGAGYFVYDYLVNYPNTMRIKRLAGNRFTVSYEKFRQIKDRDGVAWWKLRKRRIYLPIAPSESIDLNQKGKLDVECYYTDDDEYIYTTDSPRAAELNQHLEESGMVYSQYIPHVKKSLFGLKSKLVKEKGGRYMYASDEKKTIKSKDALTTSQRALLVNQIRKAEEEKGFSFKDNIGIIASAMVVIIVLVVVFLFWEDVMAPAQQLNEGTSELLAQQKEITTIQRDILLGIQEIVGESPESVNPPPPTEPPS